MATASPPPPPPPQPVPRARRRLHPPLWAFTAITRSAGARTLYDRQRQRGATHHQALRALANRLVGILDGCLRHHATYDETIAWAHTLTPTA